MNEVVSSKCIPLFISQFTDLFDEQCLLIYLQAYYEEILIVSAETCKPIVTGHFRVSVVRSDDGKTLLRGDENDFMLFTHVEPRFCEYQFNGWFDSFPDPFTSYEIYYLGWNVDMNIRMDNVIEFELWQEEMCKLYN